MGDPEIVFKFRHPDMQKAAEMDVRPNIAGDYRIKFKAEALPLKDRARRRIGCCFRTTCEFPLSRVHEDDRTSMDTLADVFPPLAAVKKSAGREGGARRRDDRRGGAAGHRHRWTSGTASPPRPTSRSGARGAITGRSSASSPFSSSSSDARTLHDKAMRARRGVLPRAAAGGEGLDRPRGDQDGSGLPAEGQSAASARVSPADGIGSAGPLRFASLAAVPARPLA